MQTEEPNQLTLKSVKNNDPEHPMGISIRLMESWQSREASYFEHRRFEPLTTNKLGSYALSG